MSALPKAVFEKLRSGTFDALPRVVAIARARTPRVVRRRWCKAALLASRDVVTEPYIRTDKKLTTKVST